MNVEEEPGFAQNVRKRVKERGNICAHGVDEYGVVHYLLATLCQARRAEKACDGAVVMEGRFRLKAESFPEPEDREGRNGAGGGLLELTALLSDPARPGVGPRPAL